jgi:hypothetical protein
MNKITYYPTMFHTNPFCFNMTEFWDTNGNQAKDLVLTNNRAIALGISEMILNIRKFSAFDENGNEHLMKDFPNRAELNPKGMHTEFFIKIKSMLNLEEGTYCTFRFYLSEAGNTFVYSDRSRETIAHKEYLDFEIKDGLQIKGDEDRQVVMRFDFEPYTLASYFRPILKLFKRPKPFTGKIAGSMGN